MSGRALVRAGAACLLCLAAASATPTGPEPERNAPLIMENADHFEGYRSRGEYVLSGKVRFRHGELRLETERAVWQKDRNIVFCEAGMRITRNGALLTAERGTYDKNLGQATAHGNVFMRDSAGEVAATGQSIVYMRFKHLATLTGNPEVRRFYLKKDSAGADPARAGSLRPDSLPADSRRAGSQRADSPRTGKGKPSSNVPVTAGARPAADSSGLADTLSIKGDIMTYDDSLQVAIADGSVRIDRDKMHITCKKAEYHDASDSLYLLGDPQVVVDDNQVKGEIMRMGMHGEEIKSLLVKGKAQAHSLEPATDSTAARQSDVNGDSLFLAFKEKAIDSVQVFRNAKGAYFDLDKPAYVNKMSGEYMVLRFAGKQVASANVLGGPAGAAKSTYYHFEQKRLKGKNDAEGDTIDFAFKAGRIEEVLVKGTAKGTYFGEKAGKAAGPAQGPAETAGDSARVESNPAPSDAAPDTARAKALRPAQPPAAAKPIAPESAPVLPDGAPARARVPTQRANPARDIPRKVK